MRTIKVAEIRNIAVKKPTPAEPPDPPITKHGRFIKYAGTRVAKAIEVIELIGRCANPQNYEYSQEEVAEMFDGLREVIDEIEKKFFKPKSKEQKAPRKNFFLKD